VDPDPQELDLIARRQTRPGQDSRRLIHELSGSALGDAHAMLAKLGGQSRPALISTHPGWLPWLPWLDANIEVQWAW
jgi:hypothetical protein